MPVCIEGSSYRQHIARAVTRKGISIEAYVYMHYSGQRMGLPIDCNIVNMLSLVYMLTCQKYK